MKKTLSDIDPLDQDFVESMKDVKTKNDIKEAPEEKSLLNIDAAELDRVGKDAIARAHAYGLCTTHGDGKRLFKLHQNGRKEYVRTDDTYLRSSKKNYKRLIKSIRQLEKIDE